ncbi:MAG: rhodanese-like domain-containing protein [Chloroflexota bacterium]
MATAVESTEQSPIEGLVGPTHLDNLVRAGRVRVLDVRSPAEYQSVHIPGSVNLPLDELPRHRDHIAAIAGPIVLVCRSGTRAREAELRLLEAGARDVHVLDGGLLGWEGAGLRVTRGVVRWSLERQVRAIAGGLVLLGTLGSLLLWQPSIYLAIFVGAGLLFAGVTDTCMMGTLLMRLPYNRGATCDIPAVVAQLRGEQDVAA